jgi:hypothetical protein
MIAETAKPNLDVFHHLLYEISRGLRDLALYTIQPEDQELIESELRREEISYLFRTIEDGRVNVYFGHKSCVDVADEFGTCPHCHLSPEQDFILGIMLGYHRARQCDRYLSRKKMCKTRTETCTSGPAVACCQERDDGCGVELDA